MLYSCLLLLVLVLVLVLVLMLVLVLLQVILKDYFERNTQTARARTPQRHQHGTDCGVKKKLTIDCGQIVSIGHV